MKKSTALELLLLGLLLALGAILRFRALDLPRLGPDDGNYLFSAGIFRLGREGGLSDWIRADWDWAFPGYYQHSYLHQWLARWWYRLGASCVTAIRLSSVLTSLGTALVVYLFTRRVLPERRWTGLLAASIVALQCLHVHYSRTGWGQTGCTFFYSLYFVSGYGLLVKKRAGEASRDAWLGLAMGSAGLLAYGFHEMITVHVVGMALVGFAYHLWGGSSDDPPSTFGERWNRILKSRKTWVYAASTLPIAFLLLRLLGNDFAREHWINFTPEDRGSFLETRLTNLDYLFNKTHIQSQISWPVLLLALAGTVSLARRKPFLFRYITASLCLPLLLFILMFKDAHLVRIYLPSAVLLAILAAEGGAFLIAFVGARARVWAGAMAGLAFVAWMALTTWHTTFGWEGDAFFEPRFHVPEGFELRDPRGAVDPIVEYLQRELEPGEFAAVMGRSTGGGIAGEFSILFRFMDRGIAAKPYTFAEPKGNWPRFAVGVVRGMDARGLTESVGGPYRLAVQDAFGRLGLYERNQGGNSKR